MQNALNLKATRADITKTLIGCGSVDNTTDLYKPVSTAMQIALNLKAHVSDSLKSLFGWEALITPMTHIDQ